MELKERLTPSELVRFMLTVSNVSAKSIKMIKHQIIEADYYELAEVEVGGLGYRWFYGRWAYKVKRLLNIEGAFTPIVFDLNGWMLDGAHRTVAAKKRGDKTIRAYIGKREDGTVNKIGSHNMHIAKLRCNNGYYRKSG